MLELLSVTMRNNCHREDPHLQSMVGLASTSTILMSSLGDIVTGDLIMNIDLSQKIFYHVLSS